MVKGLIELLSQALTNHPAELQTHLKYVKIEHVHVHICWLKQQSTVCTEMTILQDNFLFCLFVCVLFSYVFVMIAYGLEVACDSVCVCMIES